MHLGVSAVNSMFEGSSGGLGAFERSGVTAKLMNSYRSCFLAEA
jgi:hypothetical protein